jgi:hypothetical protein
MVNRWCGELSEIDPHARICGQRTNAIRHTDIYEGIANTIVQLFCFSTSGDMATR